MSPTYFRGYALSWLSGADLGTDADTTREHAGPCEELEDDKLAETGTPNMPNITAIRMLTVALVLPPVGTHQGARAHYRRPGRGSKGDH